MKPTIHGQTTSMTRHYVPALTGLRAVAAYMVFFHHHNPMPPNTAAYHLINQGYTGVAIFFVLSGFLIYHHYADSYFSDQNWSWRTYVGNRFARIFPLYILLYLLTLAVKVLDEQPISRPVVLLNTSLLKGFFDTYKFTGIAQSWSLTVELCFYLSAPFLFTALNRFGPFWLTLSLVGSGLILWQTLGQSVLLNAQASGFFDSLPFVQFYTFFGRAFEFVVGMWLAQRWHQNQLPNLTNATFLGFLVLVGCLFWQAALSIFTTQANSLFWSELIVYNYLLPIGIGLFFIGVLTHPSGTSRFLSNSFLQTAGKSSYAFFLIHNGVVANGLQKIGISNVWILFVLLIGISYGLYNYLERPVYNWLKKEIERLSE
ncbi:MULTISPECIES: acyltransferase [unclassified Spirosoma]|uniref:acyltransferase family protein n=1 Tax=unclassified Spirosoma TaxID=2621999 RepID=UPI000AE2E371|nr:MULTISPECIES: acyltransferase [unclassified Spirosoma]MBN8822594.1 acyltransferase [Spirosoma sp.]